jgi:WD40 repeat protein
MAIGAKLTVVSEYLFRRLFKVLFRYDIFISYARRDGKGYALKLKEQLTRLDFSCFLDYDELPAGNSLNRTLKRAVKRSATIIVVGTEGALKSRYVELEVGEFARTGRAIIPIDFEGTLADAPWAVVKERDLVWVDETKDALAKNIPSPPVADAVDKLFKYTRRNVRVRGQVIATAALFVLGAVVSVFFIWQNVKAANVQRGLAEVATGRAQQELAKAEAATERAKQQEELATASALKAQQKEQEANEKTEEARKQREIATAQTAEAHKQATIARAKAEEARQQQLLAEERQKLATSRELAANSASQSLIDTQASLVSAVKAEETAHTAESENALRQSLLEPSVQAVIDGYQGEAASGVFSPDGKFIVTVTGPSTEEARVVRVAEVSSGRVLARMSSPRGISSAATFSPDGKTVLLADYLEGVLLWRWGAQSAPARIHVKGVESATFSLDGRAVVATTGGGVEVWEAGEGLAPKLRLSLGGLVVNPGTRNDHSINPFYSPDGRFIVAESESSQTASAVAQPSHVWEVSTGRRLPELQDGGYVVKAQFSADGKLMLGVSEDAGRHRTMRLWDLSTGRHFAGVEDVSGDSSLAFSPDGKYFVTNGRDSSTAQVWKVPEANDGEAAVVKLLWVLGGHLAPVTGAAFSSDGRFVLTGSEDMTARLWDVSTGRLVNVLRGHKGAVQSVAFSPGGEFMLTTGADEKARVWGASMGQGLNELVSPQKMTDARFNTESNAMTGSHGPLKGEKIYSPDGKYALTIKDDFTLEVSEAVTGRSLASRRFHTANINSAAFSQDGRSLATASDDTTAQVWEWKSERPPVQLKHNGRVLQVVFSPDGQHVATVSSSDHNAARLWQLPTRGGPQVLDENKGESKGLMLPGSEQAYPSRDMAFSPDGRLLVAASWDDNPTLPVDAVARVWDLQTEMLALPPLQGHSAPVVSVAFSPDGRFILTGSEDGTARLWNASTGRTVTGLFGNRSYVRRVSFGGDGASIIILSDEARLYLCPVCGHLEDLLKRAKQRVTWQLQEAVP